MDIIHLHRFDKKNPFGMRTACGKELFCVELVGHQGLTSKEIEESLKEGGFEEQAKVCSECLREERAGR